VETKLLILRVNAHSGGVFTELCQALLSGDIGVRHGEGIVRVETDNQGRVNNCGSHTRLYGGRPGPSRSRRGYSV